MYADLKFTPIDGTEVELADLIINLEDIILAIQLKDTISYITSEKVSLINAVLFWIMWLW